MTKIFISHASEDKDDLVRPLAHALKSKGLRIWYDEFVLKAGDSLRCSIDRGLSECEFGLVILSHNFFSKEWPQRELDALYSAEIEGRSKIIPIWHKIDANGVTAYSPLLADKVAISSNDSVEECARKLTELFDVPQKLNGQVLAEKIESQLFLDEVSDNVLYKARQLRFLKMNAYKKSYEDKLIEIAENMNYEEIENFPKDKEKVIVTSLRKVKLAFSFPEDIYLIPDEPVRPNTVDSYLHDIGHWSSGTLSREACEDLVDDLDKYEFDEYYILLNIPNFLISGEQRYLLESLIVEMGCGYEDGYEAVIDICRTLRNT